MIAYHVTRRNLREQIARDFAATLNKGGKIRKGGYRGWLRLAAEELRGLKQDRTYIKSRRNETLWRQLRSLFASIQSGNGDSAKCAFCEECFHLRSTGEPDADVEHFRPKNGVKEWEPGTGSDDADCYYLFAFDPRNYLLACRICNQDFKKNYFPLDGPRCSAHSLDLYQERPYLIHPLDPNHGDPEDLIEFVGVTPIPKAGLVAYDKRRAEVTIRLLHLASGRLDIIKSRARVIRNLYLALKCLIHAPNDPNALGTLALLGVDSEPHRNCARSFVRLYHNDPVRAEKIAIESITYLSNNTV